MPLYGGIEAGGTKFVCIIAENPESVIVESRFSTQTPEDTLSKAVAFFQSESEKLKQPLKALGVACFGPVDLIPSSPTYGYITTTPKAGWKNTDIVGHLKSQLNIPVLFDTDVNAAAFGEYTWGAAQGLEDFLYFTIGTGIGGGALVNGKPLHGMVHPEMGHISLPHSWEKDPFAGTCPFHQDCFEGLACGPAIEKRWGIPAPKLPPNHPAWELEAYYIAEAMRTFICTLSPQRIILGGGVMEQKQLFPMIQKKTLQSLNGYIQSTRLIDNIDEYIIAPQLGNRAGVLGAIALAREAY
ncbi:MAG TPA: ROK family protein [Anaerolineaceae bacterium]